MVIRKELVYEVNQVNLRFLSFFLEEFLMTQFVLRAAVFALFQQTKHLNSICYLLAMHQYFSSLEL